MFQVRIVSDLYRLALSATFSRELRPNQVFEASSPYPGTHLQEHLRMSLYTLAPSSDLLIVSQSKELVVLIRPLSMRLSGNPVDQSFDMHE